MRNRNASKPIRRITLRIILMGAICSIGILALKSTEMIRNIRRVKSQMNSLPSLEVVNMDLSATNVKSFSGRPLIIVLFSTECDHCQYEAICLRKSIEKFGHVRVLFLSVEPIATIQIFAKRYDLEAFANISFHRIRDEDMFSSFGISMLPRVLVYGRDNVLRAEFTGATNFETLTKYIE